jgi:hypothetical protein
MENAPPASRRRRSKPTSMMRSNVRSEKSEPITAYLVASKLVMVQRFASGDHLARSYGCQVSQVGPTVEIETTKLHLYCSYDNDSTRYIRDSPVNCRKYLPRRKSELSVIHMPIAIAKIIFALFQMAILPRFFERLASGE